MLTCQPTPGNLSTPPGREGGPAAPGVLAGTCTGAGLECWFGVPEGEGQTDGFGNTGRPEVPCDVSITVKPSRESLPQSWSKGPESQWKKCGLCDHTELSPTLIFTNLEALPTSFDPTFPGEIDGHSPYL